MAFLKYAKETKTNKVEFVVKISLHIHTIMLIITSLFVHHVVLMNNGQQNIGGLDVLAVQFEIVLADLHLDLCGSC